MSRPPLPPDGLRFSAPTLMGLRLVRYPAAVTPSDGTIAMVTGDGWQGACNYRDGCWRTAKGTPLKREVMSWTVLDDDQPQKDVE
jgi:hypothetical protein